MIDFDLLLFLPVNIDGLIRLLQSGDVSVLACVIALAVYSFNRRNKEMPVSMLFRS